MRLLNDLIIKALGVDESRVTGFESMDVEFGISLPLFAIIAALAVAGIMALLYVKTQEPLRLWKRLLLCLLRLVGMLIVVALVLGTTIVMNINRGKAPETTFLLDRTPSMSYTDGDKGASRQELMDSALNADSATFASLTDRSPVQKKLVGLAETPMSTDGTLPHTLSQALLAEQSADVAGDATSADIGDVVIFSDFHERDPEALIEAARLIREEGRRVHTVGVGTETPVDAEVLRIVGSPYAYLQDYIRLSATIRCVGADGQNVVANFYRNDDNIGQKLISVQGDPFEIDVSLSIDAEKAGAHIYKVEVSAAPAGAVAAESPAAGEEGEEAAAGDEGEKAAGEEGEPGAAVATIVPLVGETVLANNSRSLTIRTIDDKIRVLYIENHPRWEFRHIKRALELDPVVAGTFYCRVPRGVGWYALGVGGKKDPYIYLSNPAAGPPAKRIELFQYQVIILGDWGDKELQIITTSDNTPFADRLAQFVERRGGGLMLWGGNNALGAGNYKGTPIDRISPVSLEVAGMRKGAGGVRSFFGKVGAGVVHQIEGEFKLQITDEGLMHPIFSLLPDPSENREFWNTLPDLDGSTKVGNARPGASVLAVHPDNQQAIVAVWHYGFGKVLVNAVDTTFLWHLGLSKEQQEKRLYERWVSQLVRWASPDPLQASQKVRIVTRQKSFEANSPMRVRVSLVDRFFNPVTGTRVEFILRDPEGNEVISVASSLDVTPGIYEATFLPEMPGRHVIFAKDLTGDAGEDQMAVNVTAPYIETSAVALRTDVAKRVAEAGGGQYVHIDQVDDLLGKLGTETKEVKREIRARLATAPGVLALLLLVFAAEWYIRKRSGLP